MGVLKHEGKKDYALQGVNNPEMVIFTLATDHFCGEGACPRSAAQQS
ncbi:hypothetical protein FHW68_001416 [Pseudomonas sp. Tn43]|nr:hypothetical protein [Pseudomonas sp. Tn43]